MFAFLWRGGRLHLTRRFLHTHTFFFHVYTSLFRGSFRTYRSLLTCLTCVCACKCEGVGTTRILEELDLIARCATLQHTATHSDAFLRSENALRALEHAATHCNTLQRILEE